jgi:hypothetical protein
MKPSTILELSRYGFVFWNFRGLSSVLTTTNVVIEQIIVLSPFFFRLRMKYTVFRQGNIVNKRSNDIF